MISEIDIRDWEGVNFSIIKKDDKGRYLHPNPMEWYAFYEQVMQVYRKQMSNGMKKVPLLERKS